MLNPTNFKITVAISECHVLGMQIHAGIDEGGGGYSTLYLACFRDFCAMRELLVQPEALMQG